MKVFLVTPNTSTMNLILMKIITPTMYTIIMIITLARIMIVTTMTTDGDTISVDC